MTADIGIMGKHPGYGDFVRHGIDRDLADRLGAWIDETLSGVRSDLGDDWDRFWDTARPLRFWIGRAVLGRTMCGVFHPSRDKVGRRYPLILVATGAAQAAPVSDPVQDMYDGFDAHLVQAAPGDGAAALLDGFAGPVPEAEDDQQLTEGPIIWAHHPDGNLAALLDAAGPVDHARAATMRSYWWSSGADGLAVWLAVPGLPQPTSLAWLLGGTGAAGGTG